MRTTRLSGPSCFTRSLKSASVPLPLSGRINAIGTSSDGKCTSSSAGLSHRVSRSIPPAPKHADGHQHGDQIRNDVHSHVEALFRAVNELFVNRDPAQRG